MERVIIEKRKLGSQFMRLRRVLAVEYRYIDIHLGFAIKGIIKLLINVNKNFRKIVKKIKSYA